jgi:soluble lytic murein transglycosylase-like protein
MSPAGGVPGRLAPLASRVAQVESGNRDFMPNGSPVTSRAGARHAMQVMPSTAHNPGFGVRPARSDTPEEFNRVGRDYLAAMQQRYGGDTSKALAAYNAGPGRVDDASGGNWLSAMPSETQSYVGKLTAPTKIASKAEYDALPSGAMFIAPDGTRRRKP